MGGAGGRVLDSVGVVSEDPVAIVRRAHAAFNDRDREALMDCLDEGVVWNVPGESPMAGTYRGARGLWEEYMEPLWASPARVEDVDVRLHGEYVVALGDAIHNFGDGEHRFPTVEVVSTRGGRIVERWEFTSGQAELDEFLIRGCAADLEQAPD